MSAPVRTVVRYVVYITPIVFSRCSERIVKVGGGVGANS